MITEQNAVWTAASPSCCRAQPQVAFGVRFVTTAPEDRDRGITFAVSAREYETATRHKRHIACPGHADYVKN